MNKIMTETLKSLDPQIYGLAESELERQRVHIELIASENLSPALCWRYRVLSLPINTRRVTLIKSTMAGVSLLRR